MQRYVLRPLPVVYACAGCPEFGYSAPRAAAALDRFGKAEVAWLGAPGPKPLDRLEPERAAERMAASW